MFTVAEENIADLIRELQGSGSLAQLATRAGVDKSLWTAYLQGRRPESQMAHKIADNLGLSGEQRRRWFSAAGVDDLQVRYLSDPTLTAARLAEVAESDPEGFSRAVGSGFRGRDIPQKSLDALRRLFEPDEERSSDEG